MKDSNDSSKTILVLRFSALGDVAMTVHVIREFLQQNPGVQILYVSREKFRPLFQNIPNLEFLAADLDDKHKGILGLYALARELNKKKIFGIADLHNVLRTQIIRKFLSVKNSGVLDKGRKERKQLLQKNKTLKPIKSMPERYADVFRGLGFELNLSHQLPENLSEKENAIGIAPFAMYEGKMYPLEKMRAVALKIAENGFKVYLFGGNNEAEELESWEKLHPNVFSIAGKLDFEEELELIKKLKLMVSMDSANMHLASLVGTRAVSVWGNTHPFMGFLGYGQSMKDVIQDETLTQRPTSVFGKESKKAEKIDYFQNISPEIIVAKILTSI